MKKIVSLILIIALLIATLFILAGCGKASVVGTWSGKNNDDVETEWEFKKDGKCIMKNAYGYEGEGTYSIEDTKLKIKLKSWDEEKIYEFKLEGDKLSLTPTDPYSPKYPELIKK